MTVDSIPTTSVSIFPTQPGWELKQDSCERPQLLLGSLLYCFSTRETPNHPYKQLEEQAKPKERSPHGSLEGEFPNVEPSLLLRWFERDPWLLAISWGQVGEHREHNSPDISNGDMTETRVEREGNPPIKGEHNKGHASSSSPQEQA